MFKYTDYKVYCNEFKMLYKIYTGFKFYPISIFSNCMFNMQLKYNIKMYAMKYFLSVLTCIVWLWYTLITWKLKL